MCVAARFCVDETRTFSLTLTHSAGGHTETAAKSSWPVLARRTTDSVMPPIVCKADHKTSKRKLGLVDKFYSKHQAQERSGKARVSRKQPLMHTIAVWRFDSPRPARPLTRDRLARTAPLTPKSKTHPSRPVARADPSKPPELPKSEVPQTDPPAASAPAGRSHQTRS